MLNVDYQRARSVPEALRMVQQPGAVFIAGGTNLLDLMKGGVSSARALVDVSRLSLTSVAAQSNGGLTIGAMVRNSDLANDRNVRERYPLLSQALLSGASPQLRNMATVGGNLLQRTRCPYFYDPAFAACNKRDPGSGCAALEGYNRNHAIVGASEHCVATNPSDMNVALAALRAVVVVQGDAGERRIPIADFHRLPGKLPQLDTNLQAGELITAVELPSSQFAEHSTYLKVRDRASYAFALVSVAAGLELRDGTVQSAALALGGIAHKPWRSVPAEQALLGKPLTDAAALAAADIALEGAQPLKDNAFKLPLARRSIARALLTAGGLA